MELIVADNDQGFNGPVYIYGRLPDGTEVKNLLSLPTITAREARSE